MSKFIRSIGKCRWNGLGAELHENKDKTATIKFDKNGSTLHHSKWQKFDSVEDAEKYIDFKSGSNALNTLINILDSNDSIN